jgi:hypothetical protein
MMKKAITFLAALIAKAHWPSNSKLGLNTAVHQRPTPVAASRCTMKQPVNNIPNGNLDSRFALQRRILAYLATVGQPQPSARDPDCVTIGHLPRAGDVIDALGLPRDKSSYATVSRALARLCKAGKVDAYYGQLYIQGKGARYCLATTDARHEI